MSIKTTAKPEKTSLVLPLFLIIAPITLVIICFIVYSIFGFTISDSVLDNSNHVNCAGRNMTLTDAAWCAKSNEPPVQLFGESSRLLLVINIFTFGIGGLSIIAFLPCMIIGIGMLSKRLKARKKKL